MHAPAPRARTARPPASPSRWAPALAAALLLAAPGLALAHAGADGAAHHGAASGFAAGFAHPFSGLDHLAAMLAIGAWGATAVRRWWAAPAAFAVMVLLGALLSAAGLKAPMVEPAIATSLVVLGAVLAGRAIWPVAPMVAVAACFAIFHGAAHGTELGGPAALAGMVAATALLHAMGLAIGFAMRGQSAWWPRLAGTAVTMFGTALLIGWM
ncbi:HupE/UreJ family protein [Ideonella sp. A 288]|uniref:HupE/UreJ family protein n=1 Tax=Ideonella sp. A 288 TaxID=1962181 RepID=UPI000B4A7D8C|nr:HupE/UreJ family protein [Ideonella sp. A 288]